MAIKNLSAFKNRLKRRLDENASIAVQKVIFKSTNLVRNTAIDGIARGVKSGNPRPQGGNASAPGQYPATDTGFLISQITTNVKIEKDRVIGQIISSAPYSKFLEFGTSKMLPRPFMHPSLRINEGKIKSLFKKEGLIR